MCAAREVICVRCALCRRCSLAHGWCRGSWDVACGEGLLLFIMVLFFIRASFSRRFALQWNSGHSAHSPGADLTDCDQYFLEKRSLVVAGSHNVGDEREGPPRGLRADRPPARSPRPLSRTVLNP